MNLGLSEEQQMLQKSARDFFEKECPKSLVREMARSEAGHDPQLWQKMAGLGWMGLAFPDACGGSGGSFLDLVILLEEMGRACLPGPYFSTVVLCGLTIVDAGSEELKKTQLPLIARGERLMAFCLTEPSASYDAAAIAARATLQDGHYLVKGTKLFINDAHIADDLLCVARTSESHDTDQGITLFLMDARSPGIACTVLNTIGLDKQCEVVFNDVSVGNEAVLGNPGHGWPVVTRALERAAVGKCADMVGSAAAALEMSTSYARERVQFGRPIGSFQAIQHYCANMAVDVEASRIVTYYAAWRISEGLPCAMDVSIAKHWVNEACQRVTTLGHQIHGGLGFCDDHDMHLFHRRVRGSSLLLGDTTFHQKAIAGELLA
ncbi:MAG: acyl-CoA dehydrogenase [Chloroflexi bacterium]|nr:acyl-CoA dehydrogenase [Chloroflexota bacterium]